MAIFAKIWEYLSSTKGQRNVLIILFVLAIIYFRGCGDQSQTIAKYEQNIAALNDSIRIYKTKNGEIVYEKNALIVSKNELSKYSKDLEKEIKYLKDNPIVVIKWKTKIEHDTVFIPVVPGEEHWNDDHTVKTVAFNWKYDTVYVDNNYKKLEGKYLVQVDTSLNVVTKSFMISKDEIGLSFTTGLTESKDDKLEIFIKSSYPGFKPTDVQGALIDPQKSDIIKKFFPPKRWTVGPYIGYGLYFDPSKMSVGSGINVGISVSYGLFQWKSKK